MSKFTNTVEIHAGDGACSAECSHCAFTHNLETQVNKLDENIIETQQMLQVLFLKNSADRQLSYAFSLKGNVIYPLPEMLDIGSVRVMQIGIGKIPNDHESHMEVHINTIMTKLSFLMKEFSENNKKNEKKMGLQFVIVPNGTLINEKEYKFIKLFSETFRPFIQENKYEFGQISFDSNMLPIDQLKKQYPLIMKEKNYFEEYCRDTIRSDYDYSDYGIYTQEQKDPESNWKTIMGYVVGMRSQENEFSVSRRLMGRTKKPTIEAYYEDAKKIFMKDNMAYASLYPHGALLHHSSFNVANPYLRVTHEKIREEIAKALSSPQECDESKSFLDVVNDLLMENILEYDIGNKFSDAHMQLVGKSYLKHA